MEMPVVKTTSKWINVKCLIKKKKDFGENLDLLY